MKRIKESKFFQFIKKLINYDKKYNISIMSSSISFYMLVSILSLTIIIIQIINTKIDIMDNILFLRVLSIFSRDFIEYLKKIIPNFSLKNYTSFASLSVIWSSSSIIHSYNLVADEIYREIKKRNSIKMRLNSLIMFLMLLVIGLFELVFIVYSHHFIENILLINNYLIKNILELLVEIIMIFNLIILLYIYVPPIKMSLKKTYIGAIFSTLLIYLILELYLLLLNFYQKISVTSYISFIISSSLILIFVINYFVILGIFINYFLNGRTKKNKLVKEVNNNSEYKEAK